MKVLPDEVRRFYTFSSVPERLDYVRRLRTRPLHFYRVDLSTLHRHPDAKREFLLRQGKSEIFTDLIDKFRDVINTIIDDQDTFIFVSGELLNFGQCENFRRRHSFRCD